MINTGIAHKQPGVGQVGAGIVRAPLACFEQGLDGLAETYGVLSGGLGFRAIVFEFGQSPINVTIAR